jgi:hypothetical protein
MHNSITLAQLREVYSLENLNWLTTKILLFYKEKRFGHLRKMESLVNTFFAFYEEKNNRVFNRLVMLYHPDKHKQIQLALAQLPIQTSEQNLCQYAHIVPMLQLVRNLENDRGGFTTPEEFEEEYGWNYQPGFGIFTDESRETEHYQGLYDEENPDDYFSPIDEEFEQEPDFITSVKRKIYGPMAIRFPVHQLEDLEEIEMAEYEISDLGGIEYCRYVQVLDLSFNQIEDITPLVALEHLKELNISSNSIGLIDSLAALDNLRILDISDNEITDISPLFLLMSLEFVNLMGNPVPKWQIEKLKEKGVVVV